MRNKWYMAGILAGALLLIWGAVSAAVNGSGLLALVPAALAAALIAGAVKVGRADSFAPRREQRWDLDDKASVQGWLKERNDAAPVTKAASKRTPPPSAAARR